MKTRFVMKAVGSVPHMQIGYISKTGNIYFRFWEYNNNKYYYTNVAKQKKWC